MEKIKVLLIEDYAMVRMGLEVCLSQSEKVELIGEAEDGLKGMDMAKRLVPDVILMDLGLPGMNGIEATSRIKQTNPDIKIIILTTFDDDDYIIDFDEIDFCCKSPYLGAFGPPEFLRKQLEFVL